MKRINFKNIFLLTLSITFISGCHEQKNPEQNKDESNETSVLRFDINPVDLDYEEPIKLTKLKKPENLNNEDDLSSFFDYSVFYGNEQDLIYTDLSKDFKNKIQDNLDRTVTDAGQNGTLSHNFLYSYDKSRLNEGNLLGVQGYINKDLYATNVHEKPVYDFPNYNFSYYQDVLKEDNDRGYTMRDFSLWKNNKGLIEVDNSEQLFYTVSQGYFPYIKQTNDELRTMFSKSLGILNRLLDNDLTDYQKYERIYSYMTNNVYYDFNALLKDPDNVDPRSYSCYYLDGVLNDNLAVCDGLSKAIVLFCGLEGIPSYHIGGVGHSGGHAYNYINLLDTYYLSCVTNGSKQVSYKNKNFLKHTYQYFLAAYNPSSEWDYQSSAQEKICEEVKKNKTYDYWSNKYVNIESNEKLSLDIDSLDKGIKLLDYMNDVAYKDNVSLDIEVLMELDLLNEIIDTMEFKSFNYIGTNGYYEDKLLVNFTFAGGLKNA